MPLVTRLLLFFLGTLAVALVCFSAALYGFASWHLHQQLDDRLLSSLHILTGAVEIEKEGLEWEPNHRDLSLHTQDTEGGLSWVVLDGVGKRIDGSGDDSAEQLLKGLLESTSEQPGLEDIRWHGAPWRLLRKRFQMPASRPFVPRPADKKKHAVLVLAVVAPLQPVQSQLRTLALMLTGLSAGLWTMTAFGGRWLCRRALRPLTQMAQTARGITAEDLSQRLPEPRSHDELLDLGKAFNDLLHRLQESFERQRRFTGDASHQLRTPLTAILGQIEVLLRRERSTEDYQRVLRAVQGQALHLRQIVEMLLFLARADAEARAPSLERLDLRNWLGDHLQTWSSHPRWSDFRIASGKEPLSVLAHAPLLGQALDNLLDNACKYSPPGSPITLNAYRDGENICLEVADEGPGIAAEDRVRVFEPFFRSSEVRRLGVSGAGLGLAITKRIMTALGGNIECHCPGRGSCFVLRLRTVCGEPAPGGLASR